MKQSQINALICWAGNGLVLFLVTMSGIHTYQSHTVALLAYLRNAEI